MRSKQKLKKIVEKIIKKETHCYFISPHLDDAALSAGGLISYLADKVPVTIINVFTEAHENPSTYAVKSYLKQCGYKDAKELFRERRREDKRLFKKIGVEVINLGFTDAMWRKKDINNKIIKHLSRYIPEISHIYPTYRFHSFTGKISSEDKNLEKRLKEKLLRVTNGKKCIFFCPVAIGHYADHVIVRNVTTDAFSEIIYWSDFNYSMQVSRETKFINDKKLNMGYFDKMLSSKRKLIEGYKTQRYAIFPHGKIPILPDFYYL